MVLLGICLISVSTFLSGKNDFVEGGEQGGWEQRRRHCVQPFSRESLSSGWLKAPRNENLLLGIPPRQVSVLTRFYGLELGDTRLLNDPFSQHLPLRTRNGLLLKWEERAEARAVDRSKAVSWLPLTTLHTPSSGSRKLATRWGVSRRLPQSQEVKRGREKE